MNKKILFVLFIILSQNIFAKEMVSVPLNLGAGPALNYIYGAISDDQTFHYSLKLDMYALLDREFLQSHGSKVPKKYRGFIEGRDELRITYLFIPESLIISPTYKHTGIYGINFRPISLGLPLIKSQGLISSLGLGLNVTYMFIHSDSVFDKNGYMNFLRPGLNLQLDNIVKITKKFLISGGVDTYFYIPQEVKRDSPIFEIGDFNRTIWFVAQVYFIFNIRVPYRTRI